MEEIRTLSYVADSEQNSLSLNVEAHQRKYQQMLNFSHSYLVQSDVFNHT